MYKDKFRMKKAFLLGMLVVCGVAHASSQSMAGVFQHIPDRLWQLVSSEINYEIQAYHQFDTAITSSDEAIEKQAFAYRSEEGEDANNLYFQSVGTDVSITVHLKHWEVESTLYSLHVRMGDACCEQDVLLFFTIDNSGSYVDVSQKVLPAIRPEDFLSDGTDYKPEKFPLLFQVDDKSINVSPSLSIIELEFAEAKDYEALQTAFEREALTLAWDKKKFCITRSTENPMCPGS